MKLQIAKFQLKTQNSLLRRIRGGFGTLSKIVRRNFLAKAVNSFKPLTDFAENSFSDAWMGSECATPFINFLRTPSLFPTQKFVSVFENFISLKIYLVAVGIVPSASITSGNISKQ